MPDKNQPSDITDFFAGDPSYKNQKPGKFTITNPNQAEVSRIIYGVRNWDGFEGIEPALAVRAIEHLIATTRQEALAEGRRELLNELTTPPGPQTDGPQDSGPSEISLCRQPTK